MKLNKLIILPLLLVACSGDPLIQTKIINNPVQIQTKPKPVTLSDVKFYVVTKDNLNEFLEIFKKENGQELVFYAISVKDYENIALNIAELRRFLKQQSEIIIYYETSIKRQNSK